jgi:hypothetical protein
MAGRPCKVCSSSERARICAEMVAAGETDTAVAARLGISRPAVHRHRLGHLQPLARAVADAAGKGMPVREQREKVLAGELDAASFLSVARLTSDLRSTAERLERAAAATESGGQYGALAPLVGQQHRNVEIRGRLAGHTGFVPQKSTPGEGSLPQFNLIINMPNGVTERISGGVEAPSAMIDMIADETPVPDVQVEHADPEGVLVYPSTHSHAQ